MVLDKRKGHPLRSYAQGDFVPPKHREHKGTMAEVLVQMVIECRLPMFYHHVMSICHGMSCT